MKDARETALEQQRSEVIPTQLADGTVIHVQATLLGGDEQVSAHIPTFEEVSHIIEGVAQSLFSSLERVKPRKARVEFGVEIALESGHLTALLIQGSSTANLKIILEWGGE
jgi:hypothetical protein